MGEGQAANEVKRRILLSVLSAAARSIHRLGRVLVSVGIVDRKAGYTT